MSDSRATKNSTSGDPAPIPDLVPADGEATPPEHPAAGVWRTLSGLRKLQLAFSDPRVRRARSAADVADGEARQLLALRLKRAKASAPRTEIALRTRPEAKPTTDASSASNQGLGETSVESPSNGLSESHLLTELIAVQDQLKVTVEAHADERAAWEAMCDELKGRLNESLADAQMGVTLQGALNGARAQLRQAIDAHNTELRARLDELNTAAEERAAVEAALNTAQATHRETAEAYASDRALWETTRDELKAAVKRSAADLRQMIDAHASERATWSDTLQQVNAAVDTARADFTNAAAAHNADLENAALAHEAALKTQKHELQKAAEAQTRFEAALAKAQAEQQQAVDARAAMATAADAHHAALETREKELREAADARAKLEATLAKANAERQRASDTHASDRAVWDATRHQLEVDVTTERMAAVAAAEAHDAELQARAKEIEELQEAVGVRGRIEAALTKSEVERQEAIAAHVSDRAAWNGTRHELEARLRHAATVEQDRQNLQEALEQVHLEHAALLSTQESTERQLAETTTRLNDLAAESEAFRLRVEAEFNGDIRAELEARLHEARRLEEVGRLAGAMTPDIKDLVSSIDRCGTELTAALDTSDPRRQSAEAIVASSKRASGLLRQLLAFSEKQSRALAPVEVNDAVWRVEPVLTQLLGTDIDLNIALGPSGVINAGEDDVDHLVTAVVLSARDLLPVGGSLAIETRRVESGQVTADQPDGSSTGHFLLIVTASGYGVQPAQASSALELAVQRCGGELYFDGTGNRAIFRVRFSLARTDA